MFNGFGAGWPSETTKRVLRIQEANSLQQLAPELQAGISLDEDPAEWWLHRQKYMWTTNAPITRAALAGNLSCVGVSNPAGSNYIVAVLGYRLTVLAAGRADLGITSVGAFGSEQSLCQYTDTRMGSVAGNTAAGGPRGFTGASAAITRNPIDEVGLTQLDINQTRLPAFCLLAPGWLCILTSQTVNQAISAVLWGYMRAMTPEELQVLRA